MKVAIQKIILLEKAAMTPKLVQILLGGSAWEGWSITIEEQGFEVGQRHCSIETTIRD